MTMPAEAMPEAEPFVQVEREGAVVRLVLNRAGRRNALSTDMMEALQDALSDADEDASIRAIVIAAHGPAFSAGHDLKELQAHRTDRDGGRAAFEAIFDRCSALMRAIVHLPKPVIAEVQGVATAAGCQLVASCDLALASPAARFGVNGIDVGLFCSTPAVALSRNVSRKHAMEMLLTGDMLSAEDAARIGLINHVVPREALRGETDRLAAKIAAKSGPVVRLGKRTFYEQAEMGLADAYAHAGAAMADNLMHEDAAEGIAAFMAKRQPTWSDDA